VPPAPAPALLGAVAAGALAVGPIPELGFVLQGTGLGAPIGAAMAEWRRSRNPDYDGSRLGYFYRDEPWPSPVAARRLPAQRLATRLSAGGPLERAGTRLASDSHGGHADGRRDWRARAGARVHGSTEETP
jgi:hypothetical protein